MEVVGVEMEDQGSRCTRNQLFCQQHGQWLAQPCGQRPVVLCRAGQLRDGSLAPI